MQRRRYASRRIATLAAIACVALAPAPAAAEALLLVEADTGKVLHADRATTPWYPASITKILTTYVTLRAIRDGRFTLDSLLRVSANAAAAPPTKMGFAPGTTLTIDNAIKMLMVKSANDIAITIAEGVGGSVENFAELMNQHSRRIGMTQSHWVNPHGLPADQQITSARDMAILARVVLREFPEYNHYWSLPGIRLGKRVYRNHNNLMGHYPGIDGMKTGFICASGFNVVATATRDGKRLIAVVLGSQSTAVRAVKAAQLFERGFQVRPLSWLTPGLGQVESLPPLNVDPPNLRDTMCGPHRRRPPSEEAESEPLSSASADSPYAVFLSSLQGSTPSRSLLQDVPLGEPVRVFTGPVNNPSEVAPGEARAKTKSKAKSKKAQPKAVAKSTNGASSPSALAHNPPSGQVTTAVTRPGPKTDAKKKAAQKKTTDATAKVAPKPKPKARKSNPPPSAESQ
jgi:D-alanyl-D-alanine carboxypeptidase